MTQIEYILEKISRLQEVNESLIDRLNKLEDDMQFKEEKTGLGFEDEAVLGSKIIADATEHMGYKSSVITDNLFTDESTDSINEDNSKYRLRLFSEEVISKAHDLIESAEHVIGKHVYVESKIAKLLKIEFAKLQVEWFMSSTEGDEYKFWYDVYEYLQSKS